MNIYFSGMGGVGIGPLAEIALDAGYGVQGSDSTASLMTSQLSQRGIPVSIGVQNGEFLQSCHNSASIDWLVYTSALPANHPELVLARQLGIKTSKRDELLARIVEEKNLKLIAVAGTHGKTTTSGMLVWTLQQLGVPVSYSVGATLSFGPSGKFTPGSQYFVYECDEYDRNFLHFSPYVAIITSLSYDHIDTYPSETDYMTAFKQFINQSAHTIMWQADNTQVKATADDGWILSEADLQPVHLPGAHNRRNASLVAKTVEYLQVASYDATLAALARFPGTDRRFERVADNLYSDYGHHPEEIAATLQLARELSDHVVLVYQPHQNVRQHEIRNLYTDCFVLADDIYWLPTYLSREDPTLPILSPEELTEKLTNKPAVHVADMNNELWQHIQQARHESKLVLCMGAGTIDDWVREKLTT